MNILYSALSIAFSILVIGAIIYILPTGEFPTSAHDAIVSIFGYIKPWTYFINLSQFFIVLTLIVATESIILGTRLFFWFYNLAFRKN